MNQKIEKNIELVRQLFNAAEIDKALEKIDSILNSQTLNEKEKLTCEILKTAIEWPRWKIDELEEGEKKIASLLQRAKKKNDLTLIIGAIDLYGDFLSSNYRVEEAIANIQEGEVILKQFSDKESREYKQNEIKILLRKGQLYLYFLQELDTAQECLDQALILAEEITDSFSIVWAYSHLGVLKSIRGEFAIAIDYHQKALELIEETGFKYLMPMNLNNMGASYHLRGDYDQALLHYDKFLQQLKESSMARKQLHIINVSDIYFLKGEIAKAKAYIEQGLELIKEPLKDRSAYIYYGLGKIYWRKGELEKALEYLLESISLFKRIRNKNLLGHVSLVIAQIYLDKGELDKAEDFCQQAITLFVELDNRHGLAYSHYFMSQISHIRGELDRALDYSLKSLKAREEIGNKPETVETLFLMISIYLDKNDFSQTQELLERMQKINEEIDNKIVKQTYRIAKALVLKASSRPRNWMKAMEILEQVVTEEIVDHSLTVKAMINLCEILLNEFGLSGDKAVLNELESYTEKLLETAKLQESYLLSLEAYNLQILTQWLKAQYAITKVDIQKAKELLKQTKEMADESGLLRLANKIENQQTKLLRQLEQWDEFIRDYYEFIKVEK